MKELIDKQSAIDIMLYHSRKVEKILQEACEILQHLPCEESKEGVWIESIVRGNPALCCSNCGQDSGVLYYTYNYCPNCGAKMNIT